MNNRVPQITVQERIGTHLFVMDKIEDAPAFMKILLRCIESRDKGMESHLDSQW